MDRPDERLKTLLHQESNALVQAILQLALAHGFTDQTSSMRAAWAEAVERINDSLSIWLAHARPRQLDGRNDYRADPRFERLREIAWRHYEAGVPLELHHGLFTLCRQAYRQHLQQIPQRPDADTLLAVLDDFFDEAAQAMLAPWAMRPPQRNSPGRERPASDPRAGSVFRRPGKPQRPGLHHDRRRPVATCQRRCTAVLPGFVRSGRAALPAGAAAPPRHAAGRARRHPGRRPARSARHLAGYARGPALLRHPSSPPGRQRLQAGPLPHHPDERCHRPSAGH